MRKLNVSVETEIVVEIPNDMEEAAILEFATDYRHKVVEEARKNGANANVVFELIEE